MVVVRRFRSVVVLHLILAACQTQVVVLQAFDLPALSYVSCIASCMEGVVLAKHCY